MFNTFLMIGDYFMELSNVSKKIWRTALSGSPGC